MMKEAIEQKHENTKAINNHHQYYQLYWYTLTLHEGVTLVLMWIFQYHIVMAPLVTRPLCYLDSSSQHLYMGPGMRAVSLFVKLPAIHIHWDEDVLNFHN
jgi:hypothetical protein